MKIGESAMSSLDRPTALRYIDSSVLVAAAIEGDAAAIASIRADGPRLASALTFAEAARVIIRASIAGRISQAEQSAAIGVVERFRRRCEIIQISEEVLARVGRRFPIEPVRTLDAIHLASAESLGESPAFVTIVTRDKRPGAHAPGGGYSNAWLFLLGRGNGGPPDTTR